MVSLPDRYRVRGHLANGGMAGVWEADDELLGRTVAVKVLSSHLAEDPVNLGRFQREARAAARLSSHPNVVTVFDVGEHDGRAFIVMERLPGGTLADRLRAGRPPRAAVLDWLEEAAGALDFGHDHEVVHRDVKPANLLLDGAGHLHVGDFGIARIATEDAMTTSGELIGTAAYLSPEQVSGRPATAASDIYSLGIVAFELLTGRRPFGAENVAAQARQHLEAEPPAASGVAPDLPPAVDAVLARALGKAPEERWPTCAAFVAALRQALAPAAAPVPPPPAPATTRTVPLRPRPAPAAVAAPLRARRPAPAAAPPPLPEPRRRRAPLLILLGALALGAALAAVLLSGGGDGTTPTATTRAARPTPAGKAPRRATPPASTATSPAPATTPSTATTPTTPTTSTTPSTTPTTTTPTTSTPSSSSSASASTLEARGHAQLASDPAGAVTTLQQAARATGRTTDECLQPTTPACQTYAFALFDLGHALRLAGRPAEAVPILQDRLRIANQTGTVRAELAAARAASR